MIEVFKTNVSQVEEAKTLLQKLLQHFPNHKINFDLDDCDNVLRVEGKNISSEKIIEVLNSSCFKCQVLE